MNLNVKPARDDDASSMPDDDKYQRLLSLLSEASFDEVIGDVRTLALSIESAFSRDRALGEIMKKAGEHGRRDVVYDIARSVSDPYRRALGFFDAAQLSVIAGRREEALQMLTAAELAAREIEESDSRAWVQYRVAAAAAEAGDTATALIVAGLIADAYHKAGALNKIAVALIGEGRREQAVNVLTEAESVIKSGVVELPWHSGEVLCRTASALFQAGAVARAVNTWEAAIACAQLGEQSQDPQESRDSSSVLYEIVANLKIAGRVKRAEEVHQSILHRRE